MDYVSRTYFGLDPLRLSQAFSTNIKFLASQSCLVLRINAYNMPARTFFRVSRTLHQTTCGQCPENGQPRSQIAHIGSMGGVMVPDGKALSVVAAPSSAPVKGSQASGRRSPRITSHFCGSEFTNHGVSFLCGKFMSHRYWEVQVELGEAVQGWIYWTWKVQCLRMPR